MTTPHTNGNAGGQGTTGGDAAVAAGAAAAAGAAPHGHPPPAGNFITKYVFSTDHKVIAKQYLFTGIFFLLLAGAMALLIRWQLAYPWEPIPVLGKIMYPESDGVLAPENYNMLFTMHGSLMVFFAVTPILIGSFGNYIIPLQIGAPDMAFPRLNMLSYWVIFPAGALMLASFFMPGGAAAGGWTAYAPLSAQPRFISGHGQTMWLLAILLAGTSSLMGAINYLATIINLRSPGMHLMRMPLATWGLFFTSILNLLWVPLVAAAFFMLIMDRVAGTSFFFAGPLAPRGGGQPLLYQHLFWGFGHPEVYILILPVWGIVGDTLAVFSRKPAFGYKATVLSMASIVAVSQVVWGHHLFTSGMNPVVGKIFMLLTITISVPTAIFFFNWLGTIWRGAIRLDPPMLFALGVVFVFAIGGLTGLFNAVQAFDIYIHDTYFVVGHFHYTLAASVLLGAFCGIYYWFPKMFGRSMNRSLGVWHFWLTFVFLNFVFATMLVMGISGHMRRIADPNSYAWLKPLAPLNKFAGWSTFALGLVQLLFAWNFFVSLFAGKRATENPWSAASLEWTLPTPVPYYNFAATPVVVRGPFEYSPPGLEDRDFLTQSEPEPALAAGGGGGAGAA